MAEKTRIFDVVKQKGGGGNVCGNYAGIGGTGFRTHSEGQNVQFEVEQGPKGLHASQVTPP